MADMASPRLEARQLRLDWADGGSDAFPYIWLRDTDPAGFHPRTGERVFDLTSVPLDLAPEAARVEGTTLVIDWPGHDEASRFELGWLRENRPGAARPDPAQLPATAWRGDLGAGGVPRARAAEVLADDMALSTWLRDSKEYGLSIVEGLEDDVEAGCGVARRIGFLRETNFGLTFEVVSKPDPNNLAYTSDALPLHTDLTNQEMPPGWQFLHCLANEAEGGGSVFCDGVAVAEDLAREDPAAFELLATVDIPFRFHDGDTDIRARKTVIRRGRGGEIEEICFNAHLADILDIDPAIMPDYYAAYRRLMQMTRDPAYLVTLKLKAGEMVVFDNRRVLHGRAAFDPSTGFRHLRGCYVDRGEFDSRIRVLARARDRAEAA
ncbi:TauD/TfdA family dioxygenase [Limimaricola hongkongensis]|uniref:Gamma-butyrobetaine dioxygenase n=1 Tax=Limimaricola hongkongensis DSM 17492 TaxID=1122180 RepID=A0A017HG67_9RHOB|nr:TauD/TfdA family dioxygenase [Limimaricola hongkongensis]EYD73482.1 Gamma-butyrobetaine dioxygenase [Limimaricola hongkongensis DSM 17492]